jgi:16S rRNA (cytidine1402-2'-O)-methyltransferase
MAEPVLYVVATPIGNFSDITLRALEVLKTADLILSEDTRETDKLLRHYGISKAQISYRDQIHERVMGKILEFLDMGKSIVLVSDSGTPLISDPGFKLVRDVKKAGFKVVSLPGPSAVIAALSISGLPTDKFTFLGFLPKTAAHKEKLLKEYAQSEATVILYESPFRVEKTLNEIFKVLGDRTVSLAVELTKSHERVITDKLSNILSRINDVVFKGEFVILIAKKDF